MTTDQALQHIWPDFLARQLVGWMSSAQEHNPAIRAELEKFVAALTPHEEEAVRISPLLHPAKAEAA